MLETIVIFAFVAALTVLCTAGWVLFLFLWTRSLSGGTRSLAAALLGSAGFIVPILVLGREGFGSKGLGVMLVAVAVLAGIFGLPTALLANRKLERIGTEPAAVFD